MGPLYLVPPMPRLGMGIKWIWGSNLGSGLDSTRGSEPDCDVRWDRLGLSCGASPFSGRYSVWLLKRFSAGKELG